MWDPAFVTNMILVWVIGGVALSVLNIFLFRFALARKIVCILCAIALIILGASYMNAVAFKYGEDTVNIMRAYCMGFLIMAVLMAFGDSLQDFDEVDEYRVGASEFMGVYFVSVSEERSSAPKFFLYYIISTAVAFAVLLLFIATLSWHKIFMIIGCIVLGYELILKPIILRIAAKRY